MSKLLVAYWSGTGNTQTMAEAVAEGAKAAGAEVVLTEVNDINANQAAEYTHIALGCPSMGCEVLEEGDMEPFFSDLEPKLDGKKLALFGSYDWGDGQWMRDWTERCKQAGAAICQNEGLIAHLTPNDDAIAACKALGEALSKL